MLSRSLSLKRSVSLHHVDVEEALLDGEEADRTSRASASGVSVVPLTLDHLTDLVECHNDGFGSKKCCLCCPVADTDGRIRKYYEEHPERLPVCGVAVKNDGRPLGYIQLAIHPMNCKDGLHTTEPGECYVEQICVSSRARGMGVGTALLNWADDQALAAGSSFMSLVVLKGNVAYRLYDRVGYRDVSKADFCEQCCDCFCVVLLVGRPFGFFDPNFGSILMRKKLKQ